MDLSPEERGPGGNRRRQASGNAPNPDKVEIRSFRSGSRAFEEAAPRRPFPAPVFPHHGRHVSIDARDLQRVSTAVPETNLTGHSSFSLFGCTFGAFTKKFINPSRPRLTARFFFFWKNLT